MPACKIAKHSPMEYLGYTLQASALNIRMYVVNHSSVKKQLSSSSCHSFHPPQSQHFAVSLSTQWPTGCNPSPFVEMRTSCSFRITTFSQKVNTVHSKLSAFVYEDYRGYNRFTTGCEYVS